MTLFGKVYPDYQFVHVGGLFLRFKKTDIETTSASSINTSLDTRDNFAIIRGLARSVVTPNSR